MGTLKNKKDKVDKVKGKRAIIACVTAGLVCATGAGFGIAKISENEQMKNDVMTYFRENNPEYNKIVSERVMESAEAVAGKKITYEEFRNDVDYLYGDDFAKSAIDVFATKNVRTEVNELEKENDALGFATTCVGGAAGLLFGAAAISSAIEKTRRDKAEADRLVKTLNDDYTM